MKKKSYTMAELLVTLAVISVIMGIALPLLNKVTPNKDILTYKKALYTLESAAEEGRKQLIKQKISGPLYWASATDSNSFCSRIIANTNVVHSNKPCKSFGSYDNPQMITVDGIRFWNMPTGAFTHDTNYYICVDRHIIGKEAKSLNNIRSGLSTNCGSATIDGTSTNVGLKINVRADGRIFVNSSYVYENTLIKNSFENKPQ